jgi:hypothetical protein
MPHSTVYSWFPQFLQPLWKGVCRLRLREVGFQGFQGFQGVNCFAQLCVYFGTHLRPRGVDIHEFHCVEQLCAYSGELLQAYQPSLQSGRPGDPGFELCRAWWQACPRTASACFPSRGRGVWLCVEDMVPEGLLEREVCRRSGTIAAEGVAFISASKSDARQE